MGSAARQAAIPIRVGSARSGNVGSCLRHFPSLRGLIFLIEPRKATGDLSLDRTITYSRPLANPLHAILLAFPLALYPSALLSDIAYYNTAEIQWSNFSSWVLVGANFFAGLVLVWALFRLFFGHAQSKVRRL